MMEYITVAMNLALVIAIIIAAVFFLKKFTALNFSKITNNLNIMSTLSIGPKEKIILLKVYEKQLLVGVTAQSIVTLLTLDNTKLEVEDGFSGSELSFSEVASTLNREPGYSHDK